MGRHHRRSLKPIATASLGHGSLPRTFLFTNKRRSAALMRTRWRVAVADGAAEDMVGSAVLSSDGDAKIRKLVAPIPGGDSRERDPDAGVTPGGACAID